MIEAEEPIIEEKSIQDEMLYQDAKVLRYSIVYPEMSSGENKERVNAYYASRTKRLERYIRNRLFRETVSRYKKSILRQVPFFETQFTSEFHTAYITGTFFSLYEDEYEYLGGANGQTLRTAQTWLLPKGRRIRLGDFFKRRIRWRNLIFETISNTIREQMKEEEAAYFENWELLIRRYFNQNNYYLTEEGFCVYYQETTIAPHSSGVVVFNVPYYIFSGGMVFELNETQQEL